MPGTLTHSPADILARILVELELGVTPEANSLTRWQIFIGNEPDLPDEVITIYDTAGSDEGRVMADGERQEHHGIQARVRSRTHQGGWERIRRIALALDEDIYQYPLEIVGHNYLTHCLSVVGRVNRLQGGIGGKASAGVIADSNLYVFTVNALMSVREV